MNTFRDSSIDMTSEELVARKEVMQKQIKPLVIAMKDAIKDYSDAAAETTAIHVIANAIVQTLPSIKDRNYLSDMILNM